MRTYLIAASLGIGLFFGMRCAAPVHADQNDIAASPTVSSSYEVQAGDVLSVGVVGFPDLLTPQAVVLTDGTIDIPLVGSVVVTGETPSQIQKSLTQRYSKYVVDPSVTVGVYLVHPQYVSFEGYVLKPGTLAYHPNYHVLQALADDGGPLTALNSVTTGPDQMIGDLSHVTVTDPSGTEQTLDLSHPESKAGTSVDILLNVGDVVYVPQQRNEVSIVGEVKAPGSYPYTENMTVLDLLTLAGSYLPDADLSDAKIEHNGQESPLGLEALLRHGDLTQNIPLSAGDRVTVPLGARTYVYGAVAKPGFYTFIPGDTVLDAFNAAGGPAPAQSSVDKADLAKVNLIRIDKVHKTTTIQRVDLQKFLNNGDLKGDIALEPGDVLYVPTKSHHLSASDLSQILGTFGQVSYVTHTGL